MDTFDEVLGAAQGLDAADRVRLIGELWDTVPPDQWPAPSADWVAEAQRRSAEVDAGRMSTTTWDEVRIQARKEVGLDG
jgi:putative addiction module component (TIGR02574 family)